MSNTVDKFQRVYEDDYTVSTWTYDLSKFKYGPISVEIKYKDNLESKRKKK